MTCTIIAALVTCVVSSSAPKPTAAEAARIFTTSTTAFIFVAPLANGPTSMTIGNGPALGPWPLPPLSPKRRLDVTLITDPPADYWSQPTIILVPTWSRPSSERIRK